MTNSTTSSSGIGFTSLLQILFIALKLLNITDVATWSWWWVLSPTWISASLVLVIFAIVLIVKLWPRKKPIEPPKTQQFKSSFMERLENAMRESEKARNN